jgi:CSLREA domain-containing protein
VIDGNGIDRVLDASAAAEIYGVTIRNGRVNGDGGGLLVRFNPEPQPVLLRRSVVSGNQAGEDGGGIAALGSLEVRDSAILENHAQGNGGGIGGMAGPGFQLINSTVSDNRADGSGGGLAYDAGRGELVVGSTIVFNQAGVSGGGLWARPPLFPGSFAGQFAGSIVSGNLAPAGRDCAGAVHSLGHNVLGASEGCSPAPTDKAGTAEHPLAAVLRIQDTRLGPTPAHALLVDSPALGLVPAERCEPTDQLGQLRSAPCDAGAVESAAHPFCVPGGSVLCLQEGRFRVSATLDERFPSRGAQAVPLTDDTGNYWFFAPDNLEIMVKVLDGCALNGRFWVFASGLTDVGVQLEVVDLASGTTRVYDHEQGTTFPPRLDTDAFPCSPDAPGGGGTDLTSSATLSEEVFRVTKTADTDDGACDHDCSLREAVLAANSRPTTTVILVGPGIYPLTLQGREENVSHTGDLDVSAPLVILGAGAKGTVLDGGAIDRLLDVLPAGGALELHDLTVRNGWAHPPVTSDEGGGGILAAGPLTLVRSAVHSNRADLWGGGILVLNLAPLTIRDSTVSGNTANVGGGIAAAVADLENVTLSGNHATVYGGGFYLPIEQARLQHVTITGNSANIGGGIGVQQPNCPGFPCVPPIEMSRSVVAGNTASPTGGPDCFDMPFIAGAFNLFGIGEDCGPGNLDKAGTAAQPLDPRLSPLGDHGGPTLTHVPLPGSPALDHAPAGICGGTDQRGLPRPSGGCDAGAVERRASCEPDADTLCLGAGSRFRATVHWTAQGNGGPGKAVPLALDTGAFWFFDAANLELTVKVLDGCGVNNRFWVFLSGLTDVGVEVTVTDTATGETWTHTHAAGTALQPRLDTNALEVCN